MPNRKADGGISGYRDKVCFWIEQEEGQWETTCDNALSFSLTVQRKMDSPPVRIVEEY